MNDLKVIEYQNIRVLTTQQIADAYETEERRISENYNANKSRYEEGKHYIKLEGASLKEFLQSANSVVQNPGKVRTLYLWTEKGAFLQAKSLNTDKAWEAYSNLIDGYYKQKDVLEGLSQEMMAIITIDRKQVHMEKRMDKLEYDIPLYGAEADELSSHVKRKGVKVLGGKQSEAYKDSEIRSKVYRDIYDQIRREFNLYDDSGKARSYKALKRKYLADSHELVDCYQVPTYLAELIEAANAQMNLGVA
ncbi:ORF6C domain-containing protein [Lacrimispora sp.]|uniref:ORF6C domain-containing protein n=1 Tax=Lacrimispora sp. TaxID=2719234 RepID=UPI002865E4A8|nr:ORF6C domain-containing protein [Lacrimispora sp.]MDR7815155.1 ORF6C domain-containing protein [Lacrimispora sp.]